MRSGADLRGLLARLRRGAAWRCAPAWPGAAFGLAGARWLAERSATPWRWGGLASLVIAGLLLGMVLGLACQRRRQVTWPLLASLVYVLWPAPQPALGAALLIASVILMSILNIPSRPRGAWLEGAIFCGALALYVHTLAPTVLPADAGEFQTVAPLLGIAHPPGYPLYTLLGNLFTLLPVGDAAYRLNFFAAVCGAATLAVVARGVREMGGSSWGGLLSAAMLGLSPTFWVQSTTANIRSLTALFTALCLWLALRWERRRETRWLTLLGLCFGLGVGHHSSLALLGAPLLALVLIRDPRLILSPRRWLGAVGALLASLLVLLYLPIRSAMHPAFDPTPIRTFSDFVSHVLATGFRGDMLYFRTWAELWQRGGVWLNIIMVQFGPWLAGGTLLALPLLWREHRPALGLLLGVWAVNALSALTYRAPQTVEYLIPSYVAMAMLLGGGVGLGLRAARRHWPRVGAAAITAALLLAALAQGAASYPSLRAQAQDRSARASAESLLRDAPQGALILANWHQATPLWYLQRVEGWRPDVEVQYAYPEGATPNESVWLRRIAAAIDARAVLVTNRFYAYDYTDYRWIPFHDAWLVRQEPLFEAPSALTPREALCGDAIRMLGYQLDAAALSPGDTLSLRVYWQPLQTLEADYSTFVQLLGPSGVVGQGDIAQPTRNYLPGEVRVDAYRFPLLLHAEPGDYRLVTGFYTTEAEGWRRLATPEGDVITLQMVQVNPLSAPPATRHARWRAWANGLRLTGLDVDRTVGGQTRLYLHWRCDAARWPGKDAAACAPAVLAAESDVGEEARRALPGLSSGQAATVALDWPSVAERVTLTLANGQEEPISALGAWHRPAKADVTLRLPSRDRHYIPLGGQMALVDLQTAILRSEAGAALRVTPRFLALRPLVWDNSVSVGLRGQGWEIKDDGTPAWGAIPTLKWLTGWQVDDPRTLALDGIASGARGELTLSVYDAFTLHPLQVLDERLVREGQGTELRLGTVATPE